MTRVLFAAYFIEAGLILMYAPWTQFWDRNFFGTRLPFLGWVLSNFFVRGARLGDRLRHDPGGPRRARGHLPFEATQRIGDWRLTPGARPSVS